MHFITVAIIAAVATSFIMGPWLSLCLGVFSITIHLFCCPVCKEEVKRLIISR